MKIKKSENYRCQARRPSAVQRGGLDMNRDNLTMNDFKSEIRDHFEGLYRTTHYMLDNEADTESLILESFTKAYQLWQKGESKKEFRISLFCIMVGLLDEKHWLSMDSLSSAYGNGEINDYLVQTPWINPLLAGGGQLPFSEISKKDVEKAINDLPHELRLIVVLSMLESFSYIEIAKIAGIKIETVKSRLKQGRELMQRGLFSEVWCEGAYNMPADRVRSK